MAKPTQPVRSSGILLHVTSLPGPFGIGDLGPAAYAWVDALARAKQTWWQFLPLGPVGDGNSPYQAFSAFAGEPNLISPELLVHEGLLPRSVLAGAAGRFRAGRVDYPRVNHYKRDLLVQAWERFKGKGNGPLRRALDRFRVAESEWLDDYALFMALRESRPAVAWNEWPRDVVRRVPAALRAAREELTDAVGFYEFGQFLFYRQLDALRAYARSRGVRLIGDLPIFISADSSDVWSHSHLFLLDRDRRPKFVAGVPPDLFCATGQRWGNPLYDWPAMKREGYAWWARRLRASLRQADLVRIDHFRGFAAYRRIPAHLPTAMEGKWVKAPGADLFDTLKRELGALLFIAEDLGVITPDVEALRDSVGLPGMRILQFAFGGGPDSPYLPHNYPRNSVVYTGTHDNDTTVGWFASLDENARRHLQHYAPASARDPAWELTRLAWSSVADYAIAPVQDVLRLGTRARMNLPGSAEGNWGWRMPAEAVRPDLLDRLAELTVTYGRAGASQGK